MKIYETKKKIKNIVTILIQALVKTLYYNIVLQ